MLLAGMLWALAATVCMTTCLEGGRLLGFSRLSLPLVLGTWFSHRRDRATVIGFVVYVLGGWLFAAVYVGLFVTLGGAGALLGLLFGMVHGLFLLTMLGIVPHVHPHMASDYARPSATPRLEPPGSFGLNYGYGTPAVTLLGHAVYGVVLGFGMSGQV